MRIAFVITTFILLSAAVSLPRVAGQSTTVTDVSYVHTALFDIDRQTAIPQLVVNATVGYSDANPGDFLAAGVFDLEDGNVVSGLGSSAIHPCAATTPFAACLVPLSAKHGFEHMEFLLNHPKSVWNLALVAGLENASQSLIPNSFSDYTFTITISSALTLIINAPSLAEVTVDGMNGTGDVQLVLGVGNHAVSVPGIVQEGNATRLRFSKWSDGVTSPNRTITLNHDITLRAEYETQYRLQVSSPVEVQGTGWYTAGSEVTLSTTTTATMTGILGLLGAKWVFEGWTDNGIALPTSQSVLIRVDSPHMVAVTWRPDYNMPMGVVSIVALAFVTVAYTRRKTKSKRRLKPRKRITRRGRRTR
jgi:hypothetical protein